MRLLRLSVIVSLCCQFLTSQIPSPSSPKRNTAQQNPPSNVKRSADNDQRGTENSPIFVKVLPSAQTNDETSIRKSEGSNQSPDWWMFGITAIIAIIGAIQTRVFWIQAKRLKETIEKMDSISAQQTKDVRASIAEATRAASAMEGVAASMVANTESLRESVGISRRIANRQEFISELQSRAYLSVEFLGMVPQNTATGMRFEPRRTIVNRGNTPAYKVKVVARADVVPFPVRDDYPFDLPAIEEEGAGSIIASTLTKIVSAVVPDIYPDAEVTRIKAGGEIRILMWGKVTYEDAFDIARFVDFGLSFIWMNDGTTIMSNDAPRHNDSN